MRQRGWRHKRGWVKNNKKLARERAMVILHVRSGALTAKEGAHLLGVSLIGNENVYRPIDHLKPRAGLD